MERTAGHGSCRSQGVWRTGRSEARRASHLDLTVVLDVWSRRIVGWAMATHLRTELVLDVLDMAIEQRRPNNVFHHSDQGCQYTSLAFGLRCREANVRPFMGSVGDCYDNAMCESFFATLECDLLARRRFRPQAEARMAVFHFIHGWYPHRQHSALGQLCQSIMTCSMRRKLVQELRSETVHGSGTTPIVSSP